MAKVPNIKVYNKIKDLDAAIKKLYGQRDELTAKLVKKYGTGEWVTEDKENEEQPFTRLTIKDNLIDLTEGKTMYKTASFRRYDIVLKSLKHKPKKDK